ncbi:MAG: serine/threonine-protein kinase [Candidatus Obscuribacter sp.]|nr:serine/threonine-protein kinase [Candidatus Obscuribacter sp.]
MPPEEYERETAEMARPDEVIVGSSYRILSLLGKGGMGNVYLAEHLTLGQQYALKMLAPEQVTEENWQRFFAEGRAIARLQHPHIVKLYDMGVDRTGFPFYVMERLEGVSLQQLIKKKKTPDFDSLLEIFHQIASALDYAHSKGIIHRDVKPSNMMLLEAAPGARRKPQAKLVDFGIAKLVEVKDREKQRLTITGQIFGTPYYMSPEQCSGGAIDYRSDIYSFGCALFEALSGKPPFVGNSATETVMMHMEKAPPSLREASAVSYGPELETMMAKLLEKNPERRYASMKQVMLDLERIAENKPVGALTQSIGFKAPTWSAPGFDAVSGTFWKWFAIIVLLVSIGSGSFYFLKQREMAAELAEKARLASLAGNNLSTTMTDPVYDLGGSIEKAFEIQEPKKAELERVDKFLSSGKIITSSIDPSGLRVFHCPSEFSLGNFRYSASPLARNNFDLTSDSKPVQGEASLPAGRAVVLVADRTKDTLTWHRPQLLRRIGAGELNGVRLYVPSANGESYVPEELSQSSKMADDLVAELSGWTDLRFVDFDGCWLSDRGMKALDAHKELIEVGINSPGVETSLMVDRPFLIRLKRLQLSYADDINVLMGTLARAKNLESLYLGHCIPSTAVFETLRNNKALNSLRLNCCTLTAGSLPAIGRIASLETLRMKECDGVTVESVTALAAMRRDLHIEVSMTDKLYRKFKSAAKGIPNLSVFLLE